MLDSKKILNTIKKAAELCRQAPNRTGRVLRLKGLEEVFVVGDLHGRTDRLKEFVRLADLKNHKNRVLVLQELIHGDFLYDDGSDSSHQALDLATGLKCQFPDQVHYLIGNHEMAQVTGRRIAKNGKSLNAQFDLGLLRAYGEMAGEFVASYKELVNTLPALIYLENGVIISHSLPDPEYLEKFEVKNLEFEPAPESESAPGGSLYSLLWGRVTTDENANGFLDKLGGQWLVNGHFPCEKGYHFPNPKQVYLDAHLGLGGYVLLSADRPITDEEFLASAKTLGLLSEP